MLRAVGNDDITVANEQVAKEAVDEFLGPNKEPLIQNYGSRAGQQVGWRNAEGTRFLIDDIGKARPHFNSHSETGGNLHVYFK